MPDDDQLREAIGAWDAASDSLERMGVNDIGLVDMDDPEQATAANAIHAAADKITARLKELGYQSVRFLINLFFYENNKNPQEFPDRHYQR